MNSDTASQFRQALGWEPWNADHPTFGTALIKLCIGAGRLLGSGNLGVFLYILAQAVFGAAVVGYSQMLMRRLCAPVWLRALSLAVCALGTVYCDNITVILKDVPYSYAMLLMLCEMVRVRYLEDASYFGSRGFLLRMMLAGFVLLKIRNNGLLIWIPAGIALICRAVKSHRRAAVGAVCAAVVLPMLLGAGFDAAVAGRWNRLKTAQRRCSRCLFSRPRVLFRNMNRKSWMRNARSSTACSFTTSWRIAIDRICPIR